MKQGHLLVLCGRGIKQNLSSSKGQNKAQGRARGVTERFSIHIERDVLITRTASQRSSLLGEAVAAVTPRVRKMAAQPWIRKVGGTSASHGPSDPKTLRHLEIVHLLLSFVESLC